MAKKFEAIKNVTRIWAYAAIGMLALPSARAQNYDKPPETSANNNSPTHKTFKYQEFSGFADAMPSPRHYVLQCGTSTENESSLHSQAFNYVVVNNDKKEYFQFQNIGGVITVTVRDPNVENSYWKQSIDSSGSTSEICKMGENEQLENCASAKSTLPVSISDWNSTLKTRCDNNMRQLEPPPPVPETHREAKIKPPKRNNPQPSKQKTLLATAQR